MGKSFQMAAKYMQGAAVTTSTGAAYLWQTAHHHNEQKHIPTVFYLAVRRTARY